MEPDSVPLVERVLFAVRQWESIYRPVVLHVDGDTFYDEVNVDDPDAEPNAASDIERALRRQVCDHTVDWLDEPDGLFMWEGIPRYVLGGDGPALMLDKGEIRRATPADVQEWIDAVAMMLPSRPSSL